MVNSIMAPKMEKCRKFFDELAYILGETHEVVASCNKDLSAYLVPKGTKDKISYYGKPESSFRISDHWSWYSNLKKCSNPDYVQCWSVDLPKPRKRDHERPWMATEGRKAAQVAFLGRDGNYHMLYGEYWDRVAKEWRWAETDPKEALQFLHDANPELWPAVD